MNEIKAEWTPLSELKLPPGYTATYNSATGLCITNRGNKMTPREFAKMWFAGDIDDDIVEGSSPECVNVLAAEIEKHFVSRSNWNELVSLAKVQFTNMMNILESTAQLNEKLDEIGDENATN